jgi:light-regulated signal transduction histidine kinase (bacteriophytochrome)
MSTLIRDLLAYSRVGRANLKRECINLEQLVDEIVSNLQPLISNDPAKISTMNLPIITGDRYQFLRLFQNLLENSIKYRSDRPLEITIRGSEDEKNYIFCVEDNGIGFEQKDAVRIFEVFQRLHDRDRYPGSGIGLSIVQTIVCRHGGGVWAESALNKGTKIFFTLPKSSAAPEKVATYDLR